MKRSAGILVYKIEKNNIKVLLCHFGGPYWENTDIGGWTLSKGEVNNGEKVLETAKREFIEETNLNLTAPIDYLGTKKISRKKLAIMFYTNSDFELSNCKSNTFELEFPKGSGNIKSFPEMDKYEWMNLNDAKKKIIKNQLYFLNKLEAKRVIDLSKPVETIPVGEIVFKTASGKYVCSICGYVYDPEIGDPDNGIPAGTRFKDLPEDWHCPRCKQGKDKFNKA